MIKGNVFNIQHFSNEDGVAVMRSIGMIQIDKNSKGKILPEMSK